MTNRKYHWAIQVVPSMHPHAWRAHAGGYYAQACGRRKKSAVGYPAERFVAKSQRNPDWYCSDCARAARLALAKESAPRPTLSCSKCRSGAINPEQHGRTADIDLDLCDVCYWRKRAQPEPRPIREASSYPCRVLAWFPSLSGWRIAYAGFWGMDESNGDHMPTHFLPLPPEVK